MHCRIRRVAIISPILVVANARLVEECTSEYEIDAGSSLLQGFTQQSQLLEMSVDPEGDGLTQDYTHHAHMFTKLKSEGPKGNGLTLDHVHHAQSSTKLKSLDPEGDRLTQDYAHNAHMPTKLNSVDPKGDGLIQDYEHHAHTSSKVKSLAKQPQTLSYPRGHTKVSFGASTPHSVNRNRNWSSKHAKKAEDKQPSFSAHFRIGGTGEGVPETSKSASGAEQMNDLQTDENEIAPVLASTKVSSLEEMRAETGVKKDDMSPNYLQHRIQGAERAETWIESQDQKMQAAVSLAEALLSLQVTPPEFIESRVESRTEGDAETTPSGRTTTMTTTSIASLRTLSDSMLLSSQSPGENSGTGHALLETFRGQLHNNFACLAVAIINGPLQTLAIVLLLFLGYTLRKEVLELKASNAELMQKVYDMTAVPTTANQRSDRRWFGRSDSRADWLRANEVVGGRE